MLRLVCCVSFFRDMQHISTCCHDWYLNGSLGLGSTTISKCCKLLGHNLLLTFQFLWQVWETFFIKTSGRAVKTPCSQHHYYSKIIFLKLELVHVELLHWHDWHSIFPKLRVEFLLPPYSRQMKPRRKLDLLTCQGKKFCAFFSFYCALTPFSITSINSLLWDGIWDFCRIATPTSTLFTQNITSFPSYLFIF